MGAIMIRCSLSVRQHPLCRFVHLELVVLLINLITGRRPTL